jgi:hypothetical protein
LLGSSEFERLNAEATACTSRRSSLNHSPCSIWGRQTARSIGRSTYKSLGRPGVARRPAPARTFEGLRSVAVRRARATSPNRYRSAFCATRRRFARSGWPDAALSSATRRGASTCISVIDRPPSEHSAALGSREIPLGGAAGESPARFEKHGLIAFPCRHFKPAVIHEE